MLLLSSAAAIAQEQLTGPPPVLVIGQEEIKPGSMGAHEKQVASYLALFNRANVRGSRLGLVPVSGDDNQILHREGYASFADLEATRNKSDETFAAAPALQAELDTLDRQTGPMHATQKTLIAVYRPASTPSARRSAGPHRRSSRRTPTSGARSPRSSFWP